MASDTSAYNTPQAQDDAYSVTETQAEAAQSHILWLNVMANDLGGNSKTLWSIDDGDNLANLFQSDAQVTFESSALGATIYIKDGKVAYDLTPIMAQVNALSAGEILTDTLTYAIRLGNGTLSFGEVKLNFQGANDAVTIQPGGAAATVAEDSSDPVLSASGTILFGDVDLDDTHSVIAAPTAGNSLGGTLAASVTSDSTGTGAGTVTWFYQLDNSVTQYLAAGESVTEYFTVSVVDNHGSSVAQQVAVTVVGTDDLSVVSGTSTGAVMEDAAVTSVNGKLDAFDIDGADDNFTAAAGSSSYGSYAVDATGHWSYTLDNSNVAVGALNNGDSLVDSFAVVTADGVSQQVSITIGGTNDLSVVSGTSTGSVIEDAAVTSVNGKLDAFDIDGADDNFTAAAGSSGYGSYAVDATGHWSYTLDNSNVAVGALNNGDSLVDSFAVVTADGVSQQVSITIGGHSDFLPAIYEGVDPNDFDHVLGVGATVINGTDGNDIFDRPVNNVADIINGMGGDDSFFTYGGVDQVYAGSGNDFIVTGGANDLIYGQSGNDEVYAESNIDRIYGGSGNDTINGGAADDIIYGGSGDDIIIGQGGDDVIIGGYGADTFLATQTSNHDRFVYLDVRDTGDTFNDFRAVFTLDFSAIDADQSIAGDQAFLFGGETPTAHGIWTSLSGGGHLYLDTDGDASTAELSLTFLDVAHSSLPVPQLDNLIL